MSALPYAIILLIEHKLFKECDIGAERGRKRERLSLSEVK